MDAPDADVVALALERHFHAAGAARAEVYEIAAATGRRRDAARITVVLRPYSVPNVVSAHYALLDATGYGWSGRVAYADAARPRAPALASARRVLLGPAEREAAAARLAEIAAKRSPDDDTNERVVSEDDLADLVRAHAGEVVARLDAPVFEVSTDPYAEKGRGRPRVLVVDDDPTTIGAVGRMGVEVDAEKVTDGWTAVERILDGDYDLVLCAVKLDGELGGSKVFKMVAQQKPDAASRMVFVAEAAQVSAAPPASVRGRVLPRPVDATAVRELLERFAAR